MKTKFNYLLTFVVLCVVLLNGSVAYSQGATFTIKGQVTDDSNKSVAGATVVELSTMKGTTTDANGGFSITVKEGSQVEVSYIGYETVVATVSGGMSNMNVKLKSADTQIDDIVVVGFGSSSRQKITGSIATVSTEDFKNRPITDVSLALQGKVSGVQVTQNSGQPGSDQGTVNIRGIGTLNDSSPLVIVDGFESSFSSVDSKDIASISVLKDAASASIYGNKAANGVILITTKKGQAGKSTIEYNGYLAIQTVANYPDLVGSVEYMELKNEANLNSGLDAQFSDEYIDNFRSGDKLGTYPDRDWADYYFKPAVNQNHYITTAGGAGDLAYNLSMGYTSQDGILEGTDLEKYNFRANINNSYFNDFIKLNVNAAGYTQTVHDLINGAASTLGRIIQMPPYVVTQYEGYGYSDWFYTDAVREAGGGITNNTRNFNGNVGLTFQFTPNLKLEGAVSYDRTVALGQEYAPNVEIYSTQKDADGNDMIGLSTSNESSIKKSSYDYGSLSSWATLSYVASVGEHNFKVMTGAQQYEWSGEYFSAERSRLTTNLPVLSVGDATSRVDSNWASEVNSLGVFGRFNYDFASKYLLEANLRYDGSSKFAEGHKWGLFPSASLGWIITEEQFMESATWLDNLKLRLSWGQLGNEKIGNSYAGTDILTIGSTNYIWDGAEVTGAAVSYIANKDLSWETTEQINFGVDFTLFYSLDLTVDVYQKETRDILMQIPVSSTLGYTTTPYQNAGAMLNKGIEFTANYSKNFDNGIGFNVGGNISFNKNTITDLEGMGPMFYQDESIMWEEGYAINTLYGYEVEGIYQSEAEIKEHLVTFDDTGAVVNSYSGLVAEPGDVKFKDQNGDGIIDLDNDRVALGDTTPDFLYSLNTGVRYKNFELSLFLQGVQGGECWSTGELVTPFFNGSYNIASWVADRWTEENPNNTYSRLYNDSQRAAIKSEYFIEDMSYLRLKNVELAYNLPKDLIAKINLTNVRVYVSGQNLLTLTGYKGFDPECSGSTVTNIYSYPLVKTITFGVNIKM